MLLKMAKKVGNKPHGKKRGSKKCFIAIDESNHGGNPEVIVAALTNNPAYIQPNLVAGGTLDSEGYFLIRGGLSKRRNKSRRTPSPEGVEFVYAILSKEVVAAYSYGEVKSFFVSQLVLTLLERKGLGKRSKIELYIDGVLSEKATQTIVGSIQAKYPLFDSRRLYTWPNLDCCIPLVNEADAYAYRIKRPYENLNRSGRGGLQHPRRVNQKQRVEIGLPERSKKPRD